ncbi:uncharacterized protein [Manis javanica]|uniref:uncharacterized protein isoform X2 n=1 Tax=Manis javanica TaxID=9974 RepID=UPI003C6D31F7
MRPHRWPQLVVPTFTSPEGPPLLIQFPKDQRTIRFTCLGHPSEGLATGKGPRACLFPGQGQAWDPAGRRAPAGKACLHLPAQHPAPRAPLPAVHGTLAPRHRRCAVRPPLHTAMGLELYLDLLSQPCRAVYIFAKKNGIPFELRPVELLKGQHLTGALFQKSSSLRRLPTLKDGDFVLTESHLLWRPGVSVYRRRGGVRGFLLPVLNRE